MQQNGCLKNLKGPPFKVFGIVRFFKRNNFRVKITFSQAQHAISDFCFLKKTGVFSMRLFSKFLLPKPLLNFCQKPNVLRELRTPQGFRHYATYRRPIKIFPKNFFPQFSVFFQGFSLRKMGFFAVFSWGRMVFETHAYPFGYFLAL